jgi:hypothetical protein
MIKSEKNTNVEGWKWKKNHLKRKKNTITMNSGM